MISKLNDQTHDSFEGLLDKLDEPKGVHNDRGNFSDVWHLLEQ